jgi:hypothetical protein
VPQIDWAKLPCFSPNVTNFLENGRFLRKCESYFAGVQSMLIEGKVHGTDVTVRSPNCDYDGSYAPVQKVGSRYFKINKWKIQEPEDCI